MISRITCQCVCVCGGYTSTYIVNAGRGMHVMYC